MSETTKSSHYKLLNKTKNIIIYRNFSYLIDLLFHQNKFIYLYKINIRYQMV